MSLSQRCQYSLRALYELAKRVGQGPVKVAEIAEAQGIPPRFLEILLGQLKQAGFVISARGKCGGYVLNRAPAEVRVGDIIRFCDGPIAPVDCLTDAQLCHLYGHCAFMGLWRRAQAALEGIYDGTSLADLLQEERASCRASDFTI